MPKVNTVDDYIQGLPGWQAEAARAVRQVVRAAAPDAEEAIKWAQPVYSQGGPFCYFKAFKTSLNFGFWRGADLDDPLGLLQGDGDKMRHVKLPGMDDLNREAFAAFVMEAVTLNREKGDPTKADLDR